ncbi:lipopolysaccharide heptosyltransferase I [Chitiniphilus eburneus]|uniref:Lipopolysaccharide heptosyltransferase 1 n=1 Tax=Chitiniphilus eburneus TaxID=2571148 RepID=A0A4U0PMT6_9NEIS|nr:lipopolysaccharide heptosyltransferase I [Chitiniphilus eburneus]TJZ68612.1 lipopolysaccharide heptosyltransferase I [Chitiniphilus eburneus]
MTAPRILLVRLSSMGDVIHAMPAVTDIARALPGARIDWVVEEGFAELPALHPAVHRVIPFALRRWRRHGGALREFTAFRRALREERYDLILDVQGLVKSALVARLARGRIAGYDFSSAREGLATVFYGKHYAVPRQRHAILRVRELATAALGYPPSATLDYGLPRPDVALPWLPAGGHAVLLTATSRADKEWPERDWLELGERLAEHGLACVLPWGSPAERVRAQRLAHGIRGAVVAPRLSLTEAAALLAGAHVAVGVDTGLVHLAAAMAVPTVAIFSASDPDRTGVLASSYAVNLGTRGAAPDVDTVWRTVTTGMRR